MTWPFDKLRHTVGPALSSGHRPNGKRQLSVTAHLHFHTGESLEHLRYRVLREPPEVSGFVVVWVEMGEDDDDPASRAKGPMDAVDGAHEIVDVLQHVEAKDEVEFLLELHRGHIDHLVTERWVDVGLDEFVVGAEEMPDRELILTQVPAPASDLEDPGAGYAQRQLRRLLESPASAAEDQAPYGALGSTQDGFRHPPSSVALGEGRTDLEPNAAIMEARPAGDPG